MRTLVALAAVLAVAFPAAAGAASPEGVWNGFTPTAPTFATTSTQRDVELRMDDGVLLRANVYRPAAGDGAPVAGKLPVIVIQTCYGKDNGFGGVSPGPPAYTAHGYVVLLVDVRGTGSSEGRFGVLDRRESRDGYDVVEWAAKQPWSNGKVGVTGFSYMGASATHTAATAPPSLKAIVNGGSPTDVYREFMSEGGTWSNSSKLWNALANAGRTVVPAGPSADAVRQLMAERPLLPSFRDQAITRGMAAGTTNWDDAAWKERSVDVRKFRAPTLVFSGWVDLFFHSTPRQYRDLRMAPGRKQMVVGPWTHYSTPKAIGPSDADTITDLEIAWFDRWLKGRPNHAERLGPVTLYDQGIDRWSRYASWPPKTTKYSRLYLRGERSGSARSLNDGSLSVTPPRRAGKDTGMDDPDAGKCARSLIQFSGGSVPMTSPCFQDQRPEERTAYTYTTPRLRSPLHLNGPLALTLRGSSTAPDPLWVARLSDVAPDGTSVPITQGSLRASRRAIDRRKTRYAPNGDAVEPWHPHDKATSRATPRGVPHTVNIELWATDWVLRSGHRLRVTVAGNDTPHLVETAQTAKERGPHTVYRDPRHPSYLTFGARGGVTTGPDR